MRRVVALIALAGCRIGFDGRGVDAGSERDSNVSDAIDASPPANRVFLTKNGYGGTFGGLAGGDAICANEAVEAGLSGTFIALLSAVGTNAVDRLAGSRGWIRVDGAPVLDQPSHLGTRAMFNPIDHDAAGVVVTDAPFVWTGSTGGGAASDTCSNWTDAAGQGRYGGFVYAPPLMLDAGGTVPCGGAAFHLYCFEVGHDVAVTPSRVPGRFVFVSSAMRSAAGTGALDAVCTNDATAASLPGTYKAAVATATSSIASRFTLDSRPWVRVDGTIVADAGSAFFDGSVHRSFVHEAADGAYPFVGAVNTGGADPQTVGTIANTCDSWNSFSAAAFTTCGIADAVDATFWSNQMCTCNSVLPVLCLQE